MGIRDNNAQGPLLKPLCGSLQCCNEAAAGLQSAALPKPRSWNTAEPWRGETSTEKALQAVGKFIALERHLTTLGRVYGAISRHPTEPRR